MLPKKLLIGVLINLPKKMHFYWCGNKMSFLQYMTIISFRKYNPDWKIFVHEPTKRTETLSWLTNEQKLQYIGEDFYPKLKELPYVTFSKIYFNEIGFDENLSEIYKSDYIRWYLLSTTGGGWSDFDILYIKPIHEIDFIEDKNTIICKDDTYGHIIGFFLSKKENIFFKNILNSVHLAFNQNDYQSIGSKLLNKIYPTTDEMIKNNPKIKLMNLPLYVFYPINHENLTDLFEKNRKDMITDNTIGVHWYNGSNEAKEFNNSYIYGESTIENTITTILKNII